MSTRDDREIDAREDRVWEDQHPDLVCERCAGDGEVPRPGLVIVEPYTMRCGECDGTGYIDPDAFEDPYWEPR